MIISVSSWGDELLLDSAINSIQRIMEEECDSYFKDIAPKAIKVCIMHTYSIMTL